MDAIAALLDGPRAQGAFLLRSVLSPPWSLRIQDQAPLTVVSMVRGQAWVIPDQGLPTQLRPGHVAILRGPAPYTVADQPDTPPQVIIHPGQHCTTLDGNDLAQAMDLGVRTWGNDPSGTTVMVTGTYQMPGELSQRLLAALPELIVVPDEEVNSPVIALLADEIIKNDPGQEAVLDRLLDLLLIAVLRTWFARPEAKTPGWYEAHSDPIVGKALRMLHHNPAHAWTVGVLADETGVSRAALARRFTDLVGEPPMSYLTEWRLALAADLLREPGATITSVARRVGYGSSFALSAAFKRVRGVSPRQHRTGAKSVELANELQLA